MIEGHGDDIFRYPGIRTNFSSNVNPSGISMQLREHLVQCLDKIGSYPHPLAERLVDLIEGKEALPHGSVLATNGAVEAFYLIAELFAGKKSLIFSPSFSEYEDACTKYGHRIEYCHHNEATGRCNYSETDLVWICNPNNPDGVVYDTDALLENIRNNPQTVFVADEAYIDFTTATISLQQYIREFSNLVVVKSLTKRFAIPGLRLGYLIADGKITEALKTMVIPWRINALAIEAGMFCMEGTADDAFDISQYLSESKRVQKAINRLEGYRVVPSETIFFLVEGPVKAAALKEHLAQKHDILIRDASNFRGLSDRFFRVSVRSGKENDHLIKALGQWS
jgi:threonine-phosphate decarboxylase